MQRQPESPMRLTERGKNTIASLVGLAALAAVGVSAEAASQDNAIHDNTHAEQVTVTAGINGNSERELAYAVQKLTGTPDSTDLLVRRLDSKDSGNDANLTVGEELTITVDVPNSQK